MSAVSNNSTIATGSEASDASDTLNRAMVGMTLDESSIVTDFEDTVLESSGSRNRGLVEAEELTDDQDETADVQDVHLLGVGGRV